MVEYTCRRCNEVVEGSPYRTSCPECGAQLLTESSTTG